MNWQVINADVLDWAAEYDGPKFHAMLCDPSYVMSQRKAISLDTLANLSPGATVGEVIATYHSIMQWGDAGFMGKRWDNDIAFNPATWAALAEHLHPGAWIMAFASSRGYHRLAVAMEDSGLIIQPSIFCWAQGQGFCKATNIHAQLEKRLCYKDENKDWFYQEDDKPISDKPPFRHPLAERFYGHRYGGQVLSPKVEPIICAQKPWTDPRLDCIIETGAGALWVDGGRISTNGDDPNFRGDRGLSRSRGGLHGESACYSRDEKFAMEEYHQHKGRWPANFTLQHDPGCQRVGVRKVKNEDYRANPAQQTGAIFGSCEQTEVGPRGIGNPDGTETVADYRCTESCPVRRLGEQSGAVRSSGHKNISQGYSEGKIYELGAKDRIAIPGGNTYNDKGTAARFFYQADWSYEIAERLALADPVRYQAKASRSEREGGLFGVVPCAQCGGLDTETHVNEHGRTVTCRRCDHPTVKPLSLNIWLATLLLPPPEYAPRRLLVPFAGTGSEGIGALLAGWDEVVMIDNNAEYCEIAEARTKWWAGWSKQVNATEPKDILKVGKSQPEPDDKQLELEL